jgi:hypothetical protein
VRRDFQLPEEDEESLNAMGFRWETHREGETQWLLLHDVGFRPGFNHANGSVAIQIPPGYPTAGLDMAYFHPHLARADGQPIRQAQCLQGIDGKQWQRWSRHYEWAPGRHSLSTHIVLIHRWLEAAVLGK